MHIAYLLALLMSPYAILSAVLQSSNSLTSLKPLRRPLLNDWYTPQCHRLDSPGMPGLNPTNCVVAAEILCQRLKPYPPSRGPPIDEWVWIEQPGCAVAFYRPGNFYYEPKNCQHIFSGIISVCAHNSRFNAGSVNVAVLPNFGQEGRAEYEGRNRYLLAPERLTL